MFYDTYLLDADNNITLISGQAKIKKEDQESYFTKACEYSSDNEKERPTEKILKVQAEISYETFGHFQWGPWCLPFSRKSGTLGDYFTCENSPLYIKNNEERDLPTNNEERDLLTSPQGLLQVNIEEIKKKNKRGKEKEFVNTKILQIQLTEEREQELLAYFKQFGYFYGYTCSGRSGRLKGGVFSYFGKGTIDLGKMLPDALFTGGVAKAKEFRNKVEAEIEAGYYQGWEAKEKAKGEGKK